MENKTYTPCGGCGATEPDQRCIGCMHPFTEIKPDELPVTPEWELINRIVSQWGNAVEMPNMEQWLKDYAASKTGAGWVKASEYEIKLATTYYVQWEDEKWNVKGSGYFSKEGFFLWDNKAIENIPKIYWNKMLILDESAAGRESDAEAFAKYLDEQRSSITPDMWHEKVVWESPNAFQQWLKYFKQQKESNG